MPASMAMQTPAMQPPPILPPPPMMPPPAHLLPPNHVPHQVLPPNTFIPPATFGTGDAGTGSAYYVAPPTFANQCQPKQPQPPPAFGGKCCVCQRFTSYAYIVRSHHWVCKDHSCPHAPFHPPASTLVIPLDPPPTVIPLDPPPTVVSSPSSDAEVPLI